MVADAAVSANNPGYPGTMRPNHIHKPQTAEVAWLAHRLTLKQALHTGDNNFERPCTLSLSVFLCLLIS